ncbi:MAG: histidine kinase [Chitinophagaceae bacterium]|nr:histidine kinase [Chitinophagaceae bacterium]
MAFLRSLYNILIVVSLLCGYTASPVYGQANTSTEKVQKAGKKIERGYKKDNRDTLAQGYFDLGESYYQKGELEKSESYYQKAKNLYGKMNDAEGIAKSSRALAKVQEDQHKTKEAVGNYETARQNSQKTGDFTANILNENDVGRLTKPDSPAVQESFIQQNIKLGLVNKDTGEIVSNLSRMADISLLNKKNSVALDAFNKAYQFSRGIPEQALQLNQKITDVYLKDRNFPKAIETKKEVLNEKFVQNSTRIKASEITSLADIYIQIRQDSTAIRLLNESYTLSVRNGHTLEAKKSIEKLDSIFQKANRKELSLQLYKDFLSQLPGIIAKDSSIADNRIMAETEIRIKELETEKALKDDLIRRKNIFNYWLMGSIIVLAAFIGFILFILRKLRIRNKKIALQSLRREMNPHFIFNSLNSINQFIATNNELAANQYLTKFSTLMRRVMENSKEDFVLFSKEIELLQNYLDLEKSRFPDKFDFTITTDDALLADEQLYIPGMLIQPHLENAIWHGLRYINGKGFLQLTFTRGENEIGIIIEDNGIGIAESKRNKTDNQKKRSGRGITNTLERINILNELYHQHITCEVEDKPAPGRGVRVRMRVPLLKNFKA